VRVGLLGSEGLCDVVVRAELQAAENVALVLPRREQQHGDVLVLVPDAFENDKPGQLRQVEIEDDEVGLLACHCLDRALSVVSARDVVALAAKRVFQKLHEVAVVVDDEKFYES